MTQFNEGQRLSSSLNPDVKTVWRFSGSVQFGSALALPNQLKRVKPSRFYTRSKKSRVMREMGGGRKRNSWSPHIARRGLLCRMLQQGPPSIELKAPPIACAPSINGILSTYNHCHLI